MFSFPFDPAATVFIGFILFTFALLLITKRRNDLKRENLEDDMPEQAEIHAVELNGRTIWLSNSDLEIWKGLNNFQKKAIVDKQINAIKNGRWVKVMNDNMDCTGIITREEALRTGYLLEVKYPDGSVKLWNKHELKAYQQQNKNNQLIKTEMSTTATKMEGKVKFWNKEKAYGFIKANDGTEHFVHHTGLIDQIRQDDNVSFVLKEGTKGPNAVEVTLI